MIKLLLVDDMQDEREGIRFLIDTYKLHVDVVEMSNGEDAFHYLLENHVDLLLTDIKMPFMDGLELTRRARNLDEQLKIIIFSAHGEFEYARRAIPYKVEHYILKPIEVGEFVQVMEQTIRLCEQAQELKRQEGIVQQTLRLAVQSENRDLNAKSTNKGIGHIMDIIHTEYMNDLGLEYIAEKVYMSPGYVSNLFKKETGQSFMRALTAHRLLKAQELLRETNMKVADISRRVGYPNPSYFCNLFKSHFGVSPAQFRERR